MLKKTIFAVVLYGCGANALPALADDLSVKNETYICERGVQLPVVFMNDSKGDSYAIVSVEGKLVPMRQHVAASGVLYVAFDEQDSYRLHTKGNEAFLTYMEADHTAKEQTILNACEADVAED
ncbi:MliC family protein [Bartonella sp. LJL80]